MSPVRLLALDLDGTIVSDGIRISPRVRDVLRQVHHAGVSVTLASGRAYYVTRLFAHELAIRVPLICYQGALVQDPDGGEVRLHHRVPLDLAHELIDLTRQQGWGLCAYVNDRLYAEQLTPLVRFYAQYAPIKEEIYAVADLKAILSSGPTKLAVTVEAEQAAAVSGGLRARLGDRLQIVRPFAYSVEATHLSASKGQALAFLARRLGIEQSQTMAIGDNDNDADMVAWAGLGVAMGNASAAVKASAGYVAPSIDQDGAAQAIERFVLDGHHA
jgi:Cof subfamily protein (haloacid dehalogenase superfamily)